MSYVILDIETDGFDASVIHCVVCEDHHAEQRVFYKPDNLQDYLAQYDLVIGHNAIQFDL